MVCKATTPSAIIACPQPRAASTSQISPRRFKIYFQDDNVRRRSEEKAMELLATAMDNSTVNTNSVLLAKKALRYRKVLDRMSGIDVNSPEFDASKFLGVDWCKIHNLKEYCERQC